MRTVSISFLIAILAFLIALGVFFWSTDAVAYAGNRPETCNNCHVMQPLYEGYQHAGHRQVAVCADCHLPHENILAYYFEKGRMGLHDLYVFSAGQTPNLIRASARSQEIIQSNCIRCHQQTVETMLTSPQPLERRCWDCHRTVAHGERGFSLYPIQDSAVYPVR